MKIGEAKAIAWNIDRSESNHKSIDIFVKLYEKEISIGDADYDLDSPIGKILTIHNQEEYENLRSAIDTAAEVLGWK